MSDACHEGRSNDVPKRAYKRPRQDKDDEAVHGPFIPVSASTGLQSETVGTNTSSKQSNKKKALSCGECRRLKLKCDRIFPCQSCCKRGCSEICPDGALTGGKGSRFILANTEQLHEKIKLMSDRIKQLEDALQTVHSQVSTQEHPLLRSDLLNLKRSPELFGIEQPRTNLDDDGLHPASDSPAVQGSEFSASSNVATIGEDMRIQPGFPEDLAKLSRAFPSAWTISHELDPNTRQRIRDMLPPPAEAQRLCEQARFNAFWQFNLEGSETLLTNMVHSIYTPSLVHLLPHRLGLFLVILAIGSMVDLQRGSDRNAAEKYHHLARVALCEVSIMDETSIDAIHALILMEHYLLSLSDEKRACDYAWGVLGLAVKVAQSIGLHRDSLRAKVIPEEQERKQTLFWDLVNVDARLSLMLRRPPSINLRYVDTKSPSFGYDGNVSALHQWNYAFMHHCTLPTLDAVLAIQPPSLVEILALDAKIRDFAVPPRLQILDNNGVSPPHPLSVQQASVALTREIALLSLHRPYFAWALLSNDEFNVREHPYAPSVLAVYSSACQMIWIVKTLYGWEPDLSVRYTHFWQNLFSATCVLCCLICRAPSLAFVPYASQHVEDAINLFKTVRNYNTRIPSYLAVVEALGSRCQERYRKWREGTMEAQVDESDELCAMVRRIVYPMGRAPGEKVNMPFEHAHRQLQRYLEQATAHDNRLAPIRGPVGTILHAQSDVRSFCGSDETPSPISTGYGPTQSRFLEGWTRGGSPAAFGSDIPESGWLSWI